jgi:hypothetical protein
VEQQRLIGIDQELVEDETGLRVEGREAVDLRRDLVDARFQISPTL